MIGNMIRASALLATAALVLVASPAQAQPGSHSGGGVYYLEVVFDDGTGHDTLLTCPRGRTHPHGMEACDHLEAAGGDIAAIPSTDGLCLMDYHPVTVRAHGLWAGEFYAYQGRFQNLCTAVGRTGGAVFDFAPAQG